VRKNHLLQIRISAEEKDLAKKLAESYGYGSLSEFARSRIFESQIVIRRLNEIKEILSKKGDKHE